MPPSGSVILPMIQRHHEMFGRMHKWKPSRQRSIDPLEPERTPLDRPATAATGKAYPGTDRFAPRPCNSGKKYKFCCGSNRR